MLKTLKVVTAPIHARARVTAASVLLTIVKRDNSLPATFPTMWSVATTAP